MNDARHVRPSWRSSLVALIMTSFVVAIASSVPAVADPSIGLDPSSGPPLTVVKVTGIGYCPSPCSAVTIKIDTLNVASGVPVDGDGNFTAFVRMPGSVRPGQVAVIASQTDGNGNAATSRTDFNVTISQPAPTIYTLPPDTQAPSGGLPTVTEPTTPSTDVTTPTTAPTTTAVPSTTTSTRPASKATAEQASATSNDNSSDDWTLPVIIGAAVVAALAIGGVVWWRRRRGSA